MYYIIIGLIVIASIFPYFVSDIWIIDLLDQARIQLSMLYFLLLLFLISRKRWGASAFLFAVLLINMVIVGSPYWRISGSTSKANIHSHIRVLSFNMNSMNTNLGSINLLIDSVNPNIIFLMEVNADIFQELSLNLDTKYPFKLVERKKYHPEYIAVFSNLPFMQKKLTESVRGDDFKIAKVTFKQSKLTLHFFGIHPVSPRSQDRLTYRNYQFNHIAQHIARYLNSTDYIIVAGDMNTTPWSNVFSNFTSTTGLVIADDLRSLNLSWPSVLPYPLRIPIDQVLVSSNFCNVNSYTVSTQKSDHAAIVTDLSFC